MNAWTDARGRKIEQGQTVRLLLESGRVGQGKNSLGRVAQVSYGKCLIDRSAPPQSGMSTTRDWFNNDEFVIIGDDNAAVTDAA